jgi:hypothetical protein
MCGFDGRVGKKKSGKNDLTPFMGTNLKNRWLNLRGRI